MNTRRWIAMFIGVVLPLTSVMAQDDYSDGIRPRKPHHEMNLTQDQISCLESILGKKGEGPRPTQEEMEKALTDCKIDKDSFPKPPPGHHRRHDHNDESDSDPAVDGVESQGASK